MYALLHEILGSDMLLTEDVASYLSLRRPSHSTHGCNITQMPYNDEGAGWLCDGDKQVQVGD